MLAKCLFKCSLAHRERERDFPTSASLSTASVAPVAAEAPSTWAVLRCSPGCIGRELEGRWSSRNPDLCPHGIRELQVEACHSAGPSPHAVRFRACLDHGRVTVVPVQPWSARCRSSLSSASPKQLCIPHSQPQAAVLGTREP